METVDREFLAKLAHDMRAPLTSIKGYLRLLVEGTFGDLSDEQAQILTVVLNNAGRIEELIAELSRRIDDEEGG